MPKHFCNVPNFHRILFLVDWVFTRPPSDLNSPLPGDQRQPKALPGSDLSVVADWPAKDTADKLGQISGVAVDIYGNAIIFHRGDRTWNGMTFKG